VADFNESEWKFLRALHKVALERFCKQILLEIERINADSSREYHEKYLEIFELLNLRDRELAGAFDDMRRSRAITKIANLRRLGVVTDEEFLCFSPETREVVSRMLEPRL
jgi:hypothetical protein